MANMHIIPLKQDKSPACGPGWKDETNYEQNTQLVVPGEMLPKGSRSKPGTTKTQNTTKRKNNTTETTNTTKKTNNAENEEHGKTNNTARKNGQHGKTNNTDTTTKNEGIEKTNNTEKQ